MTVVATLLTIVLSVILGFPITAAPARPKDPIDSMKRLPGGIAALEPPPDNPANPSSPAKIELGQRLFFDPLLSGDGTVSCSTCHLPEKGFADGERTSMGVDGHPLSRHTPTVINAVYNGAQNWDGEFTSIADHAVGAMTNPRTMNMEDEAVLVARLETVPRYNAAFHDVFGDVPTKRRVAEALEVYIRTLTTTNSRFGQWARGNRRALSDSEKRGLTLFIGKARRCSIETSRDTTERAAPPYLLCFLNL
jgi:cytochrome c peroxidase